MSRNPGSNFAEDIASKVSRYGLYAFMTVMPATGIAMGYFGGKGLPFFVTTLPGAAKADGAIAKQAILTENLRPMLTENSRPMLFHTHNIVYENAAVRVLDVLLLSY